MTEPTADQLRQAAADLAPEFDATATAKEHDADHRHVVAQYLHQLATAIEARPAPEPAGTYVFTAEDNYGAVHESDPVEFAEPVPVAEMNALAAEHAADYVGSGWRRLDDAEGA